MLNPDPLAKPRFPRGSGSPVVLALPSIGSLYARQLFAVCDRLVAGN